jgi:hypothetical protein
MKTNVSKRDAIAQAMDWLGQLREDDRAEPSLDGRDEPAAAPAAAAPPAPVTPSSAAVTPPPAPVIPRPARVTPPPAPVTVPPAPRASDEGNPREGAAIPERAPIGDELRIPIAWCDMDACISYYGHPAALGEADIRARAIAAGWRVDAVGRLACPGCQQRVPWFWTTQPVVPWDRGRAVTAAARLAAAVRAETTGGAGAESDPRATPAAGAPLAPWPAEGRDQEGSRGSDQAAGGRPDRA